MINKYIENLNRIEFVVTMACTGKCRHCSQGDHSSYTGHIDGDAAADAVCEICGHYKIRSLMTFGGEPLLYPEVVCRIHRTAARMGIPQRDLITNGFFAKDKGQIEEVARMLAESGVQGILLSVDAFHQETIPLEPVRYFAQCAAAAGLPVRLNPAWLVSEADYNPYNLQTRKIIRDFTGLKLPEGRRIEVSEGNVIFPSGNAAKYFSEYFDADADNSSPYEENPEDIRTISFSPNGDVLNGNIYKEKILDILNRYEPSPC